MNTLAILLTLLALSSFILVLIYQLSGSFRSRVDEWWANFNHDVLRNRRQALLNYVVCYHCSQGKGIINPVYRAIEGRPHIAGLCNACGRYIVAPLR